MAKRLFPDDSLADRAMVIPLRMAESVPAHPDMLTDHQKWQRFVKNPSIVNAVPAQHRAAFVDEMRRLYGKYGGKSHASAD